MKYSDRLLIVGATFMALFGYLFTVFPDITDGQLAMRFTLLGVAIVLLLTGLVLKFIRKA